jgi:putative transposase
MREHDLTPRRRRRFTRTTDSDHAGPIYPFVARDFEVHGPDQLWVADLTYVAIATGFVYLAVILDAWSRRVIGYAIGRSLDARHAVAALERAVALRQPLPGCVFHSDRGSQYASEKHRAILDRYGIIGSMSRRGNPYDNPQAESFMKTLKVEAVYLAEYDTYEDVAADLSVRARWRGDPATSRAILPNTSMKTAWITFAVRPITPRRRARSSAGTRASRTASS